MLHIKQSKIVFTVLLLLLFSNCDAKKIKKTKKNKEKDGESTVIDYSSFGFGFNGNETGFPTSPPEHPNFYQHQSSHSDNMDFIPNIDLTDSKNVLNFDPPHEIQGMTLSIKPDDFSTKDQDHAQTNDNSGYRPVYGTKLKKDTSPDSDINENYNMDNIFKFGSDWANPPQDSDEIAKPIPPTYVDDDFKGTIDLTENKDKDQMDFVISDLKGAFSEFPNPKEDMNIRLKFKDILRDSKQHKFNNDYSKNNFKNTDLYEAYKDQLKTHESNSKPQDTTINALDYTTTKAPFKISQFSSMGNDHSGFSSQSFSSNFGDSSFKSSFSSNHNPSHSNRFSESVQNTNTKIQDFPSSLGMDQSYFKPEKHKSIFKEIYKHPEFSKYKPSGSSFETTKEEHKFPSYQFKNNEDPFKKSKYSFNTSPRPKKHYDSQSYGSSVSAPSLDFSKYSSSFSESKESPKVIDFTDYAGKNTIDYSGMKSLWYPPKTSQEQGSQEKYKDTKSSFSLNQPSSTQTVWFDSPHASYSSSLGGRSSSVFESNTRPQESDSVFQSNRPQESFSAYQSNSPQESFSPFPSNTPQESYTAFQSNRPQETYSPYQNNRPKESHSAFQDNRPQETYSPFQNNRPKKSHSAFQDNRPQESHSGFQNNRPQETSSGFQSKRPQEFNTEQVVHIKPRKKPKNPFRSFDDAGKMSIEEWNREVSTKFKSEEDLLGLRNHDTSHPSYLPSFKFQEDMKKYPSSYDFTGAIEKWRNTKMEPSKSNLYDSFSSESVIQEAKPFEIQIPHPVIVPVPQPYPVRVPIPKPVAVPVVRELRIPIEKPVPYPVIKRVPYPVEKPVPVPIEKQVAVPVPRPYPVPIPHVKPVFHTTRNYFKDDMEDIGQDFDQEFVPSLRNTEFLRVRPVTKRLKLKKKRLQKSSWVRRRDPNGSKRVYSLKRQSWKEVPLIRKVITRYTGRSLGDDSGDEQTFFETICHFNFGKLCNKKAEIDEKGEN